MRQFMKYFSHVSISLDYLCILIFSHKSISLDDDFLQVSISTITMCYTPNDTLSLPWLIYDILEQVNNWTL